MCRCVVRYGYKDSTGNDDSEFENQLVFNLAEFIQTENSAPWIPSSSEMSLDGRMTVMGTVTGSTASKASLSFPVSETRSERVTRIMQTFCGDSFQVRAFPRPDQDFLERLVLIENPAQSSRFLSTTHVLLKHTVRCFAVIQNSLLAQRNARLASEF